MVILFGGRLVSSFPITGENRTFGDRGRVEIQGVRKRKGLWVFGAVLHEVSISLSMSELQR
jgi:hypothetical protein